MQNQGYPGTEPWAERAACQVTSGSRLLGVSTSSPCGVQAQLYRFSSVFTICSTNIPLLGQVLLWDPTLHWAVTSLQSPPTCDSSSVNICAERCSIWEEPGTRIATARKLSKTPVVLSQKQQEREGLLMAKDRECEGHKEWMETKVQKSTVVTGHHYMSDQWRLLRHQLLFWRLFQGNKPSATTKDQGMLFTTPESQLKTGWMTGSGNHNVAIANEMIADVC